MNKERITCTFRGDAITTSQSAHISISTFSRKIKLLDSPPSNVFFRTHQYEFRIVPNERLLESAGGSYGFFIRLKLVNALTNQERLDEEHKPLIDVSFEERPHDNVPWLVRVGFVSSKQYRWISKHSSSEEFYWRFDVYKQHEKQFQFVCSRCSNNFKLYSKPEVYLKQVGKCTTVPAESSSISSSSTRRRKRKATHENSPASKHAPSDVNKEQKKRTSKKKTPSELTSTNDSRKKRRKMDSGNDTKVSPSQKDAPKDDHNTSTKHNDRALPLSSGNKPPAMTDLETAKVIASLSQENPFPSNPRRRNSISSGASSLSSISRAIKSSFVEREVDSNNFESIHNSGDFLSSLLSSKANASLPTPPLMQSPPSFLLSPNKSQKECHPTASQETVNPLELGLASPPNFMDTRSTNEEHATREEALF